MQNSKLISTALFSDQGAPKGAALLAAILALPVQEDGCVYAAFGPETRVELNRIWHHLVQLPKTQAGGDDEWSWLDEVIAEGKKDEPVRSAWLDYRTPELEVAWETLRTRDPNGDTLARHPETGECWQYMGSHERQDGTWYHSFRHRDHPSDDSRRYEEVPASPGWTGPQEREPTDEELVRSNDETWANIIY